MTDKSVYPSWLEHIGTGRSNFFSSRFFQKMNSKSEKAACRNSGPDFCSIESGNIQSDFNELYLSKCGKCGFVFFSQAFIQHEKTRHLEKEDSSLYENGIFQEKIIPAPREEQVKKRKMRNPDQQKKKQRTEVKSGPGYHKKKTRKKQKKQVKDNKKKKATTKKFQIKTRENCQDAQNYNKDPKNIAVQSVVPKNQSINSLLPNFDCGSTLQNKTVENSNNNNAPIPEVLNSDDLFIVFLKNNFTNEEFVNEMIISSNCENENCNELSYEVPTRCEGVECTVNNSRLVKRKPATLKTKQKKNLHYIRSFHRINWSLREMKRLLKDP